MKTALWIALLSIPLHAANYDQIVPVEDVNHGPISFSGTVHVNESPDGKAHNRDGKVKGTNTSSQEIIAISAVVNVVGFHWPRSVIYHTHDFFTKTHGLMAGESFVIPVNIAESGDAPASEEVQPSVKAELLFVQFADGTVWGDQNSVDKMVSQRQQTEAMLRNLLNIYQTQGEMAFVTALKAQEPDEPSLAQAAREHIPSSPASAAVNLLAHYRQFGATATIENIQERLKAAAARRASGKF